MSKGVGVLFYSEKGNKNNKYDEISSRADKSSIKFHFSSHFVNLLLYNGAKTHHNIDILIERLMKGGNIFL